MWKYLVSCLLTMACALAAEHRGRVLYGGLPLPGATVTLTANGRSAATITDTAGAYEFRDLAGGPWKVRVEMLCFAPQERDLAGATTEWNLEMLPVDQIRTVAAPPSYERVQITAAPKPASDNKPAPKPQRPDAEAAADLQDRAADGFLINGSTNNSAASPFALGAAFGNTRNGQKSLYNGSLGVIFGNARFDARSYSLTGQRMPKPAYNHLTGLVSFGGPLKFKNFFREAPNVTFNYQWTRDRNASTQTGLVPTALERQGVFTNAAVNVPLNRIALQAAALLALYPLPNFTAANARYNYQTVLTGGAHQDNLQARGTKSIGRRNQVAASLALQSTRADSTNLFGFLDTTDTFGINTSANWRHSFTTHLNLTLGYQFSRLSTTITPFFAAKRNVSAEAGITGNLQDPRNWGPPTLSFASGISGLNDANASTLHNETNAVTIGMYFNRGRHNLTYGVDLRRQQFNQLGQQNPRGAFTFTGAATGFDFSGFLQGIPDTSSIAFGNADKYFRGWQNDAYFADDFRVNPGLTINYGARWEYGSPLTERYGRLVNLDFRTAAPIIGADLIRPDRSGLQPRIGLSWRPMGASSMVIRAGYGIYYNTAVYLPIVTQMSQQAPLSKSSTVQNTAASPLTLADGFKTAPGITPTTFGVDPNLQVGYAHSWQASVQHDLPGALVLAATYLGTKGTRGLQMILPNTYPNGAADPCPSCPRGFSYLLSNGNSSRHAAQLQLRRRLRAGLTGSLQYVYAKAIDNSSLGGRGQASNVIAQDWTNLSAERGRSNFDQRHALTGQLQYTTGVGMRFGGLATGRLATLLKEWMFATQITAASGLPETAVYLAAVNGTGVTGSIRPDYTGASVYDAPAGLYLNPAAFRAPTLGHWGNTGRNTITGPGQFNLNSSLGRVFRAGDRASLDFRIDAANALNKVVYTSWITNISSTQFGLPASANAMRSMQLTLRVRF